jgi:transcriptional regulator with XRE-family HTH domain
MDTIQDDSAGLTALLATRLRLERETRGWSLADLAARSGVSRAMISKVERMEASPTAVLLGRLAHAFGVTLSTLLSRAEDDARQSGRVSRAAEQMVWQDPETGYRRRALNPPDTAIDLVQVELPPGARVAHPASNYLEWDHAIWVQEGALCFQEGAIRHRLAAGDCLALGPPQDCAFENETEAPCRYLVVLTRRQKPV